jgi:hypothetical protein
MTLTHPLLADGERVRLHLAAVPAAFRRADHEYLAGAALLAVVLTVGLFTAADYGIT